MDFEKQRQKMIQDQLIKRGINDARVLEVMGRVPRENFVPAPLREMAYLDQPVAIGADQTISQPYIVAYMLQALGLKGNERALEIGTGSGYNAALLSELCSEVYSVERVAELYRVASPKLAVYSNLHLRLGDGYKGWKEASPFDIVVLTAAPAKIPEALLEQLRDGGKLLAPVGKERQELQLWEKKGKSFETTHLSPVRFVPMLEGEKS